MNPTSVIVSADWLLAVPAHQPAGLTLDFTGTRLTAAITSVFGGAPIQEVSSDDGSLAFVPGVDPYFTIDLRAKDRTLTVPRVTTVFADIKRHPDPGNPLFVEWLGRIALRVHPGSDSAGIAVAATSPVLIPAQPYEGRLLTTPMLLGPQGRSGAPRYQAVASASGVLAVDLRQGAYAKAALTAPAVLTLSGWPTDFEMGRLTLEIDIAPGGGLTAYPAGTIWTNGAPPSLSPGPAKDVLMFTSIDGGATIFGHLVGQDYR